MKIHFIAIGGSVMHSLAIALKRAGHEVTGSDDKIYDPARKKLKDSGLLPEEGWNASRISADIDTVILGMHAFEDNPELTRAKELGLPILSYPEFVYQHAQNRHRIVIAGSYGKTTVTAMVMHVLQALGRSFNYLVGGEVPGFDLSVRLEDKAPVMIIEGDEYLASRIDTRPKAVLYRPHILLINGIAWDHINVFPTEKKYVQQFEQMLISLDKAGEVIYNSSDKRLSKLVKKHCDSDLYYLHKFRIPDYRVKDHQFLVKIEGDFVPVAVYGQHNMANVAAAWKICELLAVDKTEFVEHIATFTGARQRLETVREGEELTILRDYAHSPDKVKATVSAVRERYPHSNLIACLELHTFSSLNKSFLPMYKKTLRDADQSIVLVDPQAVAQRRLEPINPGDIDDAFGQKVLTVQDAQGLTEQINAHRKNKDVLLLMSSGSFGGLDVNDL